MRKLFYKLAVAAAAVVVPASAMAGEAEDAATAQTVASNLKTSGKMHGYRIGVTCKEGTAWLAGSCKTSQQAETALAIAQQTSGVTKVINQIQIEGASIPSQEPPIARMAARLQEPAAAPARDEQVRPASAAEFDGQPPQRQPQGLPQQQDPRLQRAAPQQLRGVPVAMNRQPGPGPGDYYQGQPMPAYSPGPGGIAPARYDNPQMPGYAWPSYASYPNYAAVTYPRQYSPAAWPYIGPFYPYPQVPLGWRKVTLEWDDGWWMLDFH